MKTTSLLSIRLVLTVGFVSCFGFVASIKAQTPATRPTSRPAFSRDWRPTPQTVSRPVPDEYIDPETHCRVIHLSRFPNDRSGVIYFTYPSFSADSRYALFDVQFDDKWRYLYSFDFHTQKIIPLETSRLTQNQCVVPKTGNVYYQSQDAVWVTNLKGGTPRKIANLPRRWSPGIGFSVNADETLILGGSTDTEPELAATRPVQQVQNGPNVLFTVNIRTGEVKVIHRANAWFGHVQFSPTDPNLLMFCHEGNWWQVDRIWTMRLPDGKAGKFFKYASDTEAVGHEFWAPDGKSIWFQQGFRGGGGPRGGFLSCQDVATGKVTQYQTTPETGSIHHTFSPDGTFLVADGNARNKYISQIFIESGKLRARRLCSLKDNNYALEPNPHVSPDNKWVIFGATLFGTPQAFAVEIPPEGR